VNDDFTHWSNLDALADDLAVTTSELFDEIEEPSDAHVENAYALIVTMHVLTETMLREIEPLREEA